MRGATNGGDEGDFRETEIRRFPQATDDEGKAELRLRSEKSGQLRIRFEAPDSWGGRVEGNALVWVCGADFEGQVHRFNDLEVITDKRTYKPGETAHVLVNTRSPRSHVLFSDRADQGTLVSWRLIALQGRSTVVDVPIKAGHRPNFFLDVTTVAGYRVHQQLRQICVPPEEGVMSVRVTTDKPAYKPGETCTVSIEAKQPDGSPALAEFALSAFDKSVLYVQGELSQHIGRWFHGNLRQHGAVMGTNLLDRFSTRGNLARPFEWLDPLPPGWNGWFGPSVGDWRRAGNRDGYLDFDGGRGGEFGAAEGFGRSKDGLVAHAEAPAAAPAKEPAGDDVSRELGERARASRPASKPNGGGAPEPAFAEATLRTAFADTAAWLPSVRTGDNGLATATFTMPENLTSWRIRVHGMSPRTRVGEGATAAVTKKGFIVRLQAPRFFRERDEVVLTANVHNYLSKAKKARVALKLGGPCLGMAAGTQESVDVDVPADGEARVDWRVKVLGEGVARVAMEGLTDEESDAMQMSFPVLVHGMMRQETTTASMRPDETEGRLAIELRVPEERRSELTRLEVRFAPTLVGAMLDALPYCLDYPYGCTEQTMSRFLPAVLTLRTLQDLGIRLEDVAKIRGRLEEVKRIEKDRRVTYAQSPVFDGDELKKIINGSLARIGSMQHGDGGWGWWSTDSSSPYLTSYVLQALVQAQECDVAVEGRLIDAGMQFLKRWEENELARKEWAPDEAHAFSAYVLSLRKLGAESQSDAADQRPPKLADRLWIGRDRLNLYGKSLLALTFANLGDQERAKTGLRNVLQYVEENTETQVAHFRTSEHGWWWWWNDDIETNAWALRALVRIEPKSDLAPRLVKWLLNNRKNGYYWRSTRDTTFCVAAMADFVRQSGEGEADYTLALDLDGGAVKKEVKITKETFFTADNRFVVEGAAVGGGAHKLVVTKRGKGALYLNTYLSVFTLEEPIPAAGHELAVKRDYFLLKQVPYVVEVEGANGQKLEEKRLRYERIPLGTGDQVRSGDQIQVELRLTADNDYTFLALEDPKPAGCEPTEVQSGGSAQEGFFTFRELRDDKTVFFLASLDRGAHLIRYRLRAEIPGTFHTLPSTLFAMYAPELRANASEHLLKIVDQ